MGIGPLLETEKHDIGDLLRESRAHERESLEASERLLELTEGKNVRLEEYARELVASEVSHQDEVNEMLRQPGQKGVFEG